MSVELPPRAPEDRPAPVLPPPEASPDGPPPPRPPRPDGDTARNLLFGILALQNNFVSRDDLLGAFNGWLADRSHPLGLILRERKALDAGRQGLLEALVQEHLKLHEGDPERSLAALGSVDSARREFAGIDDADVQASLANVPADHRPEAAPESESTISLGPRTGPAGSRGGLRFRVLRHHARGGLGDVFLARDEELNREVALKEIQIRHAHDPESRARFLVEAEITGRLEHPGVVPVYGLGHHADGRPFYAMRFIAGRSLKEAIDDFHKADRGGDRDHAGRALDLRRLLQRFADVCNAVAYAHSRGILHRDLKPQNIMLGPYGETLVVDWGLAKPIGRPEGAARAEEGTLRLGAPGDSTPTQEGSVYGTPGYMSPEQAAGEVQRLGPASDVYSLGATLYCLLIGRPPFEGPHRAVLARVLAGDFLPPRTVNAAVPAALEQVCLKALALRPEERFASPRDLVDAIEQWLAEQPVSAYREAVASQEGIAREHPDDPSAREGLARSRMELALALHVLGRNGEAEAVHRAGIADYQALVHDHPQVTSYREGLAGGHSHLGRILMAIGRAVEAKDAYRAAFAEYERLVKVAPHALDYRTNLGNLMVSLGRAEDDVLRTLGRITFDPVSPIPPLASTASMPRRPDVPELPSTAGRPTPADAEGDEDTERDAEEATPPYGTPSTTVASGRPADAASETAGATGPPGKPEPGDILFDNYEIDRVLGQGGMGTVWLVRNIKLQALRVLKVMSVDRPDAPSMTRFGREARILATLRHPNAVRIYDAGWKDGTAYLEMEYVEGRALGELRKPGEPMPLAEVGALLEQLCDVLQAAGEAGIIHRDLKPSNLIVVEKPGERRLLKVLDFGLAKAFEGADGARDEGHTMVGAFVGTAAYSSPEQVTGQPLDNRTDIYSVGVILYELLTGYLPFGGNLLQVLHAHMTAAPPRFSERNPAAVVPEAVERVVLRCLEKAPARRPQSARELAEEFLRASRGAKAEPAAEDRIRSEALPQLAWKPSRPTKKAKARAGVRTLGQSLALTLILGSLLLAGFATRGHLAALGGWITATSLAVVAGTCVIVGLAWLIRLHPRWSAREAPPAGSPVSPPAKPSVPAPESVQQKLDRVRRPRIEPEPDEAPVPSAEPGEGDGDPGGEAASRASGEFGSRYEVMRPLSEGGLGRLWIVHDRQLHRDVVLKELRAEHADHERARRWFIKEGQIAAQLEHPNIIPVYDMGRSLEDRPYYTMMYVRGRTLGHRIAAQHRQARQAGPGTLLEGFLAVCGGMSYAHSRGVIHRDLKPENILITDQGEVRIGDWGLAKVVGQEADGGPGDLMVADPSQTLLTRPGTVIGTPAYMAPELALGRLDEIDARTDVYGLGAILFEILTGRPPHLDRGGHNVVEVLERIRQGETPRARSVDPSIPPALDAVCARAMARDKEDRFASAAELAAALREALAA